MFKIATFTEGNWENAPISQTIRSTLDKNLGLLEVTDIDDIPRGEKYAIYIHQRLDFMECKPVYAWSFHRMELNRGNNYREPKKKFPMPPRVWEDSKSGLVHWIIDDSTEANIDDVLYFDKLLAGLNCKRHPQNLTYMTGGETRPQYSNTQYIEEIKKQYGINIINHNELYVRCDSSFDDIHRYFLKQKVSKIINFEKHQFKSVCYNRRKRPQRFVTIAHMMYKNYTDDSIYSFGDGETRSLKRDYLERYPHLTDYFKLLETEKFINAAGERDLDLTINQAGSLNLQHALHSVLHITTETAQTPHTIITEKSYKPFLMMQPFISIGNQYNIARLREMGFRVYDKWIDHSYDEIHDPKDRLDAFLSELDRLHTKTHEEWASILFDMRGDLLYNYQKVYSFETPYPDELFKILMDFFR